LTYARGGIVFVRQAPSSITAVLVWVGLLVLLLMSGPARAGNPDLKWRTLETEHFYVHYYAGEEEIAERVAFVAERAYRNLTVALGHAVFLKTHVVLTDDTDVANGRATAVPYPRISAFATAPDALSVLESYDDWIDVLITHELTHVVHIDTVHGIPRLLNALLGFGVLGKVTGPNIVQPRWIVEGLATEAESRFTTQGRHRSAQFDMLLRMSVLERGFQTIDQVSSGARIYPHGNSVYLYGLHLLHYVAARYGHDKLKELSHVYARQSIPFGINRAIKRVLGVDFYALWEEFQEYTEQRFAAQARRIRARGLRQGRRLTFSGQVTRYPFWAQDDRSIYVYKDDGHSQAAIRQVPVRGARVREGLGIGRQGAELDTKRIVNVEDVSSGTFVGQDLVFDMMGVYDFRYSWSDLYRWKPPDPNAMEQLTFGARAREPNAAPDGRTVVFVRNDTGQSRLAFLDLATGDVEEVAPLERLHQVYTPRFSPDGTRVAYSGWREGGYRDIYVYDRTTGATQAITLDRHIDISPSWTPDGNYLVFSSDRDEVFNLYAWEFASKTVHQVSNVLGGAFEPTISHDGRHIAYVGFSSRGYDVWLMPFEPREWLPAMPSVSELAPANDPKPGAGPRPLARASARYRTYKTFFPRTFFPTALEFASSQFGTDLGVSAAIVDVLGFHRLAARFRYLLKQQTPIGSLSYSFDRLFPSFSFGFRRDYYTRSGYRRYVYDYESIGATNYGVSAYRERATTFGAAMSLPVVRHPRHRADASVGYQFGRYTNLDQDSAGVDPNAPSSLLPEAGDIAQVDMTLAYNNLEQVVYGYQSETGRRVALDLAILDRRLGGDYGDIQASASYTQMLRMPWRGHQVLAFRFAGGTSAGGLRRRGAFCVGDYPEGQDVLRSLLSRIPFGRPCSLLRGYVPVAFVGRHFSTLNIEYRIPIADVDRGFGTLPFFLRRVVAIPFVDAAGAWSGHFEASDLAWSLGAMLVTSLRLGYVEGIDLFIQYAHGFHDKLGLDSFRALVARSF